MDILYSILGISTAYASSANGSDPTGGNPAVSILFTLVPFVLIFVVMYFMMIRPQKKKEKQVKDMLANLKTGDRICTIGGIYGTITALKDDTVTMVVGSKDTPMVFARWAIRSVEEVAVENDAEQLN